MPLLLLSLRLLLLIVVVFGWEKVIMVVFCRCCYSSNFYGYHLLFTCCCCQFLISIYFCVVVVGMIMAIFQLAVFNVQLLTIDKVFVFPFLFCNPKHVFFPTETEICFPSSVCSFPSSSSHPVGHFPSARERRERRFPPKYNKLLTIQSLNPNNRFS